MRAADYRHRAPLSQYAAIAAVIDGQLDSQCLHRVAGRVYQYCSSLLRLVKAGPIVYCAARWIAVRYCHLARCTRPVMYAANNTSPSLSPTPEGKVVISAPKQYYAYRVDLSR